MELVVILVVHEYDISLTKPILNQTPSIEKNRMKKIQTKSMFPIHHKKTLVEHPPKIQ
jgi:hypothetical protein